MSRKETTKKSKKSKKLSENLKDRPVVNLAVTAGGALAEEYAAQEFYDKPNHPYKGD